MKLEVLRWPESQEVMGKEGWFFIQSEPFDAVGDSAYARIITETERENNNETTD